MKQQHMLLYNLLLNMIKDSNKMNMCNRNRGYSGITPHVTVVFYYLALFYSYGKNKKFSSISLNTCLLGPPKKHRDMDYYTTITCTA